MVTVLLVDSLSFPSDDAGWPGVMESSTFQSGGGGTRTPDWMASAASEENVDVGADADNGGDGDANVDGDGDGDGGVSLRRAGRG